MGSSVTRVSTVRSGTLSETAFFQIKNTERTVLHPFLTVWPKGLEELLGADRSVRFRPAVWVDEHVEHQFSRDDRAPGDDFHVIVDLVLALSNGLQGHGNYREAEGTGGVDKVKGLERGLGTGQVFDKDTLTKQALLITGPNTRNSAPRKDSTRRIRSVFYSIFLLYKNKIKRMSRHTFS